MTLTEKRDRKVVTALYDLRSAPLTLTEKRDRKVLTAPDALRPAPLTLTEKRDRKVRTALYASPGIAAYSSSKARHRYIQLLQAPEPLRLMEIKSTHRLFF